MQRMLRSDPRSGHPCQANQQVGREGQGSHEHHRAEKPPGLQVIVHHGGEALKVVVAEKAVPEGLSFHQQLQDVPGKADQSGEQQPGQRAQPPPGLNEIPSQRSEHQQSETRQHHSNRPLGQHGESEDHPGWPPGHLLGGGKTPPLQQQAETQQATQQGITHRGAAPDEHQRREGKGQRCDQCRQTRTGIAGERPAQHRIGEAKHQPDRGQGGRKPCRPTAERIPNLASGQGITEPHQPVHQGRFVVTGQAVHPRRQPIAGVSHGPSGCGKQRRSFIHHAGGSQTPKGDDESQGQHKCQNLASLAS